ncbi:MULTISPECIES: phosphatidate cytidylyltransferase [Zoogloea]|jgi:phosphatidate cytidylyltransferase|uniref:Phosphatidate cytidylyltransferase n=1 Tax=Zoogloea oleivorans TaxID=1552750 RepID=A0A6C2CKI5_9RHOO|nr:MULTISPECIES: phosphatidate cytidylyltransferase [Zoogloea]MDD2667414.1 phosphatidate cytidylyltransferase [Zoogloea sp.]MDY0034277.1 phosphatidate cytidylyltransferase [Zoogloea oleivorans]TYC54481.1 phosphatidate cytidylyltransferase [Zoogloea oleivorans]
MLKARVITALVLLVGLLAALFLLPALAWLGFASIICGIAAGEWAAMVGFSATKRRIYAFLLGALCMAGGMVAGLHREATVAPFGLAPVYAVSALFWLACVPFWLRAKWQLPGAGAAALVGLVLLLPPSLAIAHLRLLSPWLLLGVMAAVWIADISAYFTGRAFGRRKLAPSISPGKSWEGAYGAALGVVIYGLVCLPYLGHFTAAIGGLPVIIPALLGFTAVSIVGDLFESLVKRQAGVKDSGTLLPGHGGVLDRIDSLTSTLPMAGLLVLWIAR